MIPVEALRFFDIVLGVAAFAFLFFIVARRWYRMTYHVRMFSLSLLAFVLSPLVGVIERHALDTPQRWADITTSVGMVWIIIGLASAIKNEREETHTCPQCGSTHKVRLDVP